MLNNPFLQISTSFDTNDPFGTGQTLPPLQIPQPTVETTIIPPLKKPPKWVRRPVGASFTVSISLFHVSCTCQKTSDVLLVSFQFGGKLITFESPKQQQSSQPLPQHVYVSQVTTETEFLERSAELQAALQSGSFSSYCQKKMMSAPSDAEQDIWRFLMVCVSIFSVFCLLIC